ncbi:MAG: lipid-transfer protein [Halioglobus sp.]|nr:lipid-transfer protein [Halioglobus sp.]
MLKDTTAIAGIGQTAFGKKLEASELELACEAVLNALDDAGIDRAEVDGLASYTQESNSEVQLARNLGLGDITWFGQVGYGGGAGPGVLGNLAMAVATGQCRVGVAWRSRKRASGAVRRPWSKTSSALIEDIAANYTRPFGVLRPVDEIALLARRYMHEYGATRDHLANVALAQRRYANNNPFAAMYEKTMTREDYMAARWISRPLCLFDNCLETDGALAAVIVGAEHAADCRHRPVYIHAFAQGFHAQHQTMQNFFCDDPLQGPSWATARKLWQQSDIQAADIDVAQIYDAFTPLIPLSLEGYGFCARGEGAAFTEGGNLEPGGALPCNTSGGGLSEAYVHGFNLVTEAVRQLRGSAINQVEGAQTCLVTGGEGVPTGALVLRN